MTWEIVLGIIALVGFIMSIGKIVYNNTKAMTEMKVSLDDLKDALKASKDDIKHLKSDVADHEIRMTKHGI